MTTEELRALRSEAESAASSSDWRSAAAAYERLVQVNPKEVDLRYELAHAYGESGRLQDAIAVLRDPTIADRDKAKRRLARMYIAAEDYSAAKPLLDELIKASPDVEKFRKWRALCEERPTGHTSVSHKLEEGQALVSAGRLAEAERFYLKLLTENPALGRAYLRLGQIYGEQ